MHKPSPGAVVDQGFCCTDRQICKSQLTASAFDPHRARALSESTSKSWRERQSPESCQSSWLQSSLPAASLHLTYINQLCYHTANHIPCKSTLSSQIESTWDNGNICTNGRSYLDDINWLSSWPILPLRQGVHVCEPADSFPL